MFVDQGIKKTYSDKSHHVFDKSVHFRTFQSSGFTLNSKNQRKGEKQRVLNEKRCKLLTRGCNLHPADFSRP